MTDKTGSAVGESAGAAMICVVCREDLPALVDGQYAHAECQKHPEWSASTTPEEFAVDEAISTGEISSATQDAMRKDIGVRLAAAAKETATP
jgi:hypothetical protein